MTANRPRLNEWLFFAIVAVAGSALCLAASPRVGATFDETNYLANGLEVWRGAGFAQLMEQGTMPLPIQLATLPVYLAERQRGEPWRIATNGRHRPSATQDVHAVLPLARGFNLIFWALTLLYGWLIAWRIGGPWAGRLALVLLAAEPSLLGHAALVATDEASAATSLAFAYHFAVGRERRARARFVIPGVCYGLALLAKASALVFGPVSMIAIEVHRRLVAREAIGPATWTGFLRDFLCVLGLGIAVLLGYVGTGAPGGLLFQISHNVRGHEVYLLGRAYPHAVWFYFPLLLTMKLTLPVLLLPLLVLATRPRALFNWAFLCGGLLLLLSVGYRVQIGIRMLFPALALLIAGTAAATIRALEELPASRRRSAFAAVALGAVTWGVGASLLAWPHGINYVNELWGGTRGGYRLVSDSNYDWGQGLPELARWCEEHGVEAIDLWYFGTDPAALAPPFRPLPLHRAQIASFDELVASSGSRYLAVGATLLYGAYEREGWAPTAKMLRERQPTDRTLNFFIYELRR